MNAIHTQDEGDDQRALKELMAITGRNRSEHRAAAQAAFPAMRRLMEVMKHRSGQGYKLRAMLYSLWNGKPASLSDVLCLDWELRKDVLQVLMGFGYEEGLKGAFAFFYKELQAELHANALFDWFLEEKDDEL